MMDTEASTSDKGCAIRAAEITTGLISRFCAHKFAVKVKATTDNAGVKARRSKDLENFIIEYQQICSHRLPRQCTNDRPLLRGTALLAGIRAKQSNLHHLPKHLFQSAQWRLMKAGQKMPVC